VRLQAADVILQCASRFAPLHPKAVEGTTDAMLASCDREDDPPEEQSLEGLVTCAHHVLERAAAAVSNLCLAGNGGDAAFGAMLGDGQLQLQAAWLPVTLCACSRTESRSAGLRLAAVLAECER
jgi:hypothetical protein